MANRVELKLRERGDVVRREATNSPLKIGSGETIDFFVDFTDWGASSSLPVTTPVVTILDRKGTDVTSTLCSGGGSVVTDTEVQFTITGATQYQRYRVFVKGTVDSDIIECWTYLDCER